MEILLTLSGFIFACLVALLYEYKIKQIRKEPRNKVHFYVTCEINNRGEILRNLWIGKPFYKEGEGFVSDRWSNILDVLPSVSYKLHYSDFDDMKNGEIREVFLSTED